MLPAMETASGVDMFSWPTDQVFRGEREGGAALRGCGGVGGSETGPPAPSQSRDAGVPQTCVSVLCRGTGPCVRFRPRSCSACVLVCAVGLELRKVAVGKVISVSCLLLAVCSCWTITDSSSSRTAFQGVAKGGSFLAFLCLMVHVRKATWQAAITARRHALILRAQQLRCTAHLPPDLWTNK